MLHPRKHRPQMRARGRRRPVVESMEPRILYSADGLSALLDVPHADDMAIEAPPVLVHDTQSDQWHDAPAAGESASTPPIQTELVVIDSRVADYQKLVDDIQARSTSGGWFEIIVLNQIDRGIQQITELLAQRQSVSAVHIISHGADGGVQLGAGWVDADVIAREADGLAHWRDALTENADVLVYGCDVAQGSAGHTFIEQLARLTGADVAASSDATGTASLGGDWVLEAHVGAIDAPILLGGLPQGAWRGTLATYTVSNLNDSGAGSLRDAIALSNASTTVDDVIQFSLPGAGIQTINVSSALIVTDTVLIDGLSEPDYAGTPVVRIDGAAAGFSGISVGAAGGGSTIQGLMITGFTVDGINVASGANNVTIADNWIGTAGTGTTGIGNGGVGNSDDGIDIAGSNAVIVRNVITNSGDEGITIVGSGITGHAIQGNIIGLDPDGATGGGNTDVGIAIISGTGNTIGGTVAADRNVISKNWEGIEINTSNNTIQGNYIGTDLTGLLNRGNRIGDGVQIQGGSTNNLVGGSAAGAGNVIAYNAGQGVDIVSGSGHQVLGNVIDANAKAGVYIDTSAANNLIGGGTTGNGNVITNNGWDGIRLNGSGTGNAFLGNIIHGNTEQGIDIGGSGLTVNDFGDADTGGNNLQNFPLLNNAITSGGNTTVSGTLNSIAATTRYRVEFFSSEYNQADGTKYGEAQTLLGSTYVVTDAAGNATFSKLLTGVTLQGGAIVTATATRVTAPLATPDASLTNADFGDSSEFAGNILSNQSDLVITGGYTGDGFDNRPITGLGFRPELVIVFDGNGQIAAMRSATMNGDASKPMTGSTGLTANLIQSLDVDGFTLGNNAQVNGTARSYDWVAFGAGSNMYVGSYAGNGTSQTISGIPFQPEMVFFMSGGTGVARFDSSLTIGNTWSFDSATGGGNGVTSYNADGFGVGNGASVNASGATIHYVAFNQQANYFAQNTYAGNNSTQDVTTVGFEPEFMFVRQTSGTRIVPFRLETTGASSTNTTLYADTTGPSGSSIQELLTNGFRIGNNNDVNAGPTTYGYFAFREHDPLASIIAPTSYAAIEQTSLTLHGTGLSLVDSTAVASDFFKVTLNVGEGVLNVAAGATGATVANSGTGTVTISGTQAQINNVLAGLGGASVSYIDNLDAPSANTTLTMTAQNTAHVLGGSGAFVASDTATINITAISDVPVNTVPPAQATNEDLALTFSAGNGNQIAIADIDAGASPVEVTLSVTNGTLTLSGTAGLTFVTGTGTGDATMTVRGSVANINVALNGLVYNPALNFNGAAALTVSTLDATLLSLKIDASLQGWYEFSGNANDTGPGIAQNATLFNGVVLTTDGTRGQVLSLDGVNDYAQIGGTFSNPSEITIGGWVNLATGGVARREFITLDDRVHIALNEAGSGVKGSVQVSPSLWADLPSGQFFAAGAWHHVLYTYSDSGNVHKLYIDGVQVATATVNNSIYWAGAANTYIGRHPASGFFLGGLVDDVRIYDRVLSASEVTSLASDIPLRDTDTVAITVNPVNDVPTSAPITLAPIAENSGPRLITQAELLASAVDVEGSPLTAVGLTISNGSGSLVDNGNGTWTYTPALNDDTSVVFSYGISDGGATGGGSATLDITPVVNNAPVGVADSYTVDEDSALSVTWWDADWTRRSQITFTGNTFPGAANLADFPVLIKLNSSNIDYTQTQNSGQDLRFVDANGTLLAYEVEKWNEAGDSYVWVRVPQVDTTGSDRIFMYYGNAAATAGQNAGAVWSNAYSAVYHMASTGNAIVDSTGSGVTGVATNGPTVGTGQVGDGRVFDGVNDYVNLGSNRSLIDAASAVTYSTWVNPASVAGTATEGIISTSINNGGAASGISRFALERIGANLHVIVRSDDVISLVVDTTSNPLVAGTWKHIAVTVDLVSDTLSIYVDGVLQPTTSTGSLPGTAFPNSPSASNAIAAADDGAGIFFNGQIDDVRVAKAARGAAWVQAEYLNMTNSFVTVGAASLAPATSGVLGNDTDDGTLLSAVLVSGPSQAASFTFNPDGTFTYTPVANYFGPDSFVYRATDGSLNSADVTVSITVNPMNDAPVNTVPGAQSVNEDASLSIAGLSINDIDAGAGSLTTQLTVSNGTLNVSLAGGATISAGANSSNTLTLSGNQAQINAALATLSYQGSLNFTGVDSLQVVTNDQGNTGAGGALTDTDTVAITVNAVNDAPTATIVPANYSATEQVALTLHGTGLSIADVDAGAAAVRATVSVTSGVLTAAAGTTGVTVNGSGTTTVTLDGTLTQINNLLAGVLGGTLTYAANSDTPVASPTLTLTASDLGNTGSGSTLTGNDTATINVTAVNDAPTATIVPVSYAATEQVALALHGTGLSIADVDAGSAAVRATVSVTSGILNAAAGTTGVTVTGSGTATVILDGTLTQINNLLAGNLSGTLTFIANSDAPPASATLTLTASDLGNTGTGGTLTSNDTAIINITAISDAPVNTVPGVQSTNEDTPLVFSSGNGNQISIADVDASSSALEVTIAATNGTLTLSGIGGLSFVNGDGVSDASMTFRGTVANINAALNGLTFSPDADYNGGAVLTLSTLDSTLLSLKTDTNLQGWYEFSGNANDTGPGLPQNATLFNGAVIATDGARGQVLSLDGVNDYADLSTSTGDYAGFTQGTITGWIKATGTFETIFAVSDTADTGSYASLFLGASGYLTFEVMENNVMQLAVYRSSATINDGNWHHVAVTVGAAGNSLYVDGQLATAGQLTYDTGDGTTQRFFSNVTGLDAMAIGRNQDSGGGKWHTTGSLDDVRIYNRVLSAGEVTSLANDLPLTDTDTVAITVNPVNDAPTATIVPVGYAATEQVALTLHGTGLSIADVDAGGAAVRATVSVVGGIINAGAGTTGVSIGGNGTNTVTLDGTLTQINNLLAGNSGGALAYTATSDTPAASDVLTLTASDLGNSGAGGTQTGTDTATINITAVNDAPTASIVPLSYTATEQIALTLHGTGLSIADVDAGGTAVRATVSVTSGILTAAAGTTGVAVTGSGTATVTLDGTLTQINNLLAGNLSGTLTFTANSDTPAASTTLTLTANDLGNTGTGGTLTGNDTATINITSVNDAPVNSVPGAQSVNEDSLLTIAGLSIGDVDGGASSLTTQLTVSNGTLNVSLAGGASISAGANNSSTLTLSGNQAQINAALATLTYQGSLHFNGSDALQIVTNDLGNTGAGGALSDTDTVAITINPVNDSPNILGGFVPAIAEDTANPPGQTISAMIGASFSDPDAGASLAGILVTANPQNAAQGAWQYSTDGGTSWHNVGAISFPNALALDSATRLRFLPAADYNGSPDILSFRALDNSYAGGFTSGAVKVTADASSPGGSSPISANLVSFSTNVTAVNDAPVATVPGTPYSATEQIALNLKNSGLSVADVDGGVGAQTLILSVGQGTLNATIGGSGVIIFGSGTNSVSVTGTLGQLNSWLNSDATSTITYLNSLDNPAASTTLNVQIHDGGNTGSGGPLFGSANVTINITAVNDAPVNAVPGAQTVNEDTPLAIAGLSINDVDAGTAGMSTQLTVGNGTLNVSLAGGAAISAGANSSSTLTLSGTRLQINNALASLTYQGNLNFTGADNLQIITNDLGNSGSGGAQSDTDSVAITVNPVNDGPSLDTNTGATVNEGAIVTLTSTQLAVSDVDNTAAQLTYTVSALPANGTVRLNGVALAVNGTFTQDDINNNRVSYRHNDSETTSDQFTFSVSDGAGGVIGPTIFSIAINPVNDNAPIITSDGGGVTAAVNVAENMTAVTAVTASDADLPPDTVTYAITGGADATRFVIDPNSGVLRFNTAPDFETPTDIDGDNVYEVTVQASDGVLSDVQTINVRVINANEPPVITSNGGGNSAVVAVTENQTAVTQVTSSDADGGVPAYSIVGGVDAARFGIDAVTGILTFNAAPDFETPLDAGANNVYDVVVQVADGNGGFDTQAIAISITNVNEAPVNNVPGAQTANEDTPLAIAGLSINDVDAGAASLSTQLTVTNGTLNVNLAGGATIGAGANNSNTLTLSGTQSQINAALATLTYQGNPEFSGADALQVVTNDLGNTGSGGAQSDTDTVAISVNAVNDAPLAVVPGSPYSATEQTVLNFKNTGLSVSDVDASAGSVTVTLSVGEGVVNVTAGGSGAIVSGSGTGTVTISGNINQINNLLTVDAGSTVSYLNGLDNPSASTTLTLAINDNGNSGSGGALSGNASVAINIAATNDAPTATIVPVSYAATEQIALALHGTGLSIADADAGAVAVRATVSVTSGVLTAAAGTTGVTVTGAGSGALTLDGTLAQINALLAGNLGGTLAYTANSDTPPSAATLTLAVSDLGNSGAGGVLTGNDTAIINITAVNDAPVTTPVVLTAIAEDSGARLITQAELLANATDVDGPALTATNLAISSGAGSLVDNGNGTWTYTPALNDDTSVSFSYTVTDGSLTAAGTASLDITPVNDGPATTPVTLTAIAEDSGPRLITQAQLLVNATDIDGLPLTATGPTITSGSGTLVDNGNGTWTYTPALNDDTSVTFGYTVTDGSLTTVGTASLDITPVNDAPGNTVPGAQTASEDTPLAIGGISVTDVDGNLATSQLSVGSGSLNVDLTGGATVSAGANGSNTLTLSGSQAQINAALATLTYQGNLNLNGADTLTVLSTDGNGASDSDTVAIGVTAINDAPFFVLPSGQNTLENTPLLFSSGTGNAIVLGDVDVGGGTMILTMTVTNGTVTLGSSSGLTFLFGDGVADASAGFSGTLADLTAALDGMVFTPTAGFAGNANIGFALDDNGNTGNSPTPQVTVQGLQVVVGPVNDAPINTVPGTQTVNEDTTLVFSTGSGNAISIGDIDAGAAPVQVTLNASNGSLSLSGTAGLTFIVGDGAGDTSMTFSGTIAAINGALNGLAFAPNADFNGTASVQIITNDLGNTGAGGARTDTDTVTVTVAPVNDAPVNAPVSLNPIAEDSGPRLITQAELLANASDIDGPALSAINLTIASGNGTLIDNGNGTWTYTPALNDDTSVTFNYTVTDGSLTAAGSASLDITPVNDAPTTTPVTLAPIAEDSGTRLITQAQLLANAADAEGSALTAVNLAIVSGGGTLVDNGNGTWTYTPAADDDSAVSFSYRISDGSLVTDATASLDITPVNDVPVTTPVTLAALVEDGAPRLITQALLLANATDVDGPALSATNLAISSGSGVLVDNGDGTWTYTPAADDDGAVTFSYNVTDGAQTVAGAASLDLTPVNDAALIGGNLNGAVMEAGGAANSRVNMPTASGTLTAADVDNPPDTFIAQAPIQGTYGSFQLAANGAWAYTLDNANPGVEALNTGATLTDSFVVESADGTSQVVIVSIQGANDDARVGGSTSGTVTLPVAGLSGPQVLAGALTATDVDNPPGNLFQPIPPSIGSYGSYQLAVNGQWSYTVDHTNAAVQGLVAGQSLTDRFTALTVDGTAQAVTIVIQGAGTGSLSTTGTPLGSPPTQAERPPETVREFTTAAILSTATSNVPVQVIAPTVPPATDVFGAVSGDADTPRRGLTISAQTALILQSGLGFISRLHLTAIQDDASLVFAGYDFGDYTFQLGRFNLLQQATGRSAESGISQFSAGEPGDTEQREREGFSAKTTMRAAGISVSLGVAAWALRSGGLLAAMLSSLPAWRQMDVLPILGDPDKRKGLIGADDEDDDNARARQGGPDESLAGGKANAYSV